jgi:hypothetical protein
MTTSVFVSRHEFGYLSDDSFRLKFDSREDLDKKFKGNLFDYLR